jgi:hypothetical protein
VQVLDAPSAPITRWRRDALGDQRSTPLSGRCCPPLSVEGGRIRGHPAPHNDQLADLGINLVAAPQPHVTPML